MGRPETYQKLESARNVSDAASQVLDLSHGELVALLEVVGISDGPNLLARLKGQPTDDSKARVVRLRAQGARALGDRDMGRVARELRVRADVW